MAPFLFAIFLSAFLLFQIQPVIARHILPWYGGSPGVWTICLLFFQTGLLIGYAYAHALVTFLRERRGWQVGIHAALLLLSLLLLPITPEAAWKPISAATHPIIGILWLLTRSVGLPYVMLSASGPLLQHWFAEARPEHSPYRLYAVSNLGSLLGLLTYPFLFEPLLKLHQQATGWSFAFAGYVFLALGVAGIFLRRARDRSPERVRTDAEAPLARPRSGSVLLWILFSACGSMLLLSLTSQMSQDVAVIPFLWVLPLALYLMTFIIAFDHERWYLRSVVIPCAVIAVGLTIWLMNRQFAGSEWPLARQISVYCAAVFFCCLVCHGEIVRMKPVPRYLTGFYLCISLGGAIGGIFVSLIAPMIFRGYWELHVAFELLAFLVSLRLWKDLRRTRRRLPVLSGGLVWAGVLFAMIYFLDMHRRDTLGKVVDIRRGFYGVLTVNRSGEGEWEQVALLNGRISHGRQYPEDPGLATTYYSEESGVGTVFECLPARTASPRRSIHVGVIGLGVGTIAAYAEPGDRFRFYEINSQVEDLARKYFTYLSDCAGEEKIVLGDARITLEQELATEGSQQFDVLFVDAFSGDSIPVHLLTREAFALYFQHLKPDGVLAIHISNLHLDLADPVRNLADDFGRFAFRVYHSPDDEEYYAYNSDWVLIAPGDESDPFVQALHMSERITPWDEETPRSILWTDDYSNLFEVTR